MSSAPPPHGHDAPDDHAFTGEPVKVLSPDEPRTPGWLPLVGIALFTGAAVAGLIGHDAEPSAAKPDQVAMPAPAAPTPSVARAAAPAPPSVGTTLPKLNPEQMDRLRKVIDTSKAKGPPRAK